jgi:hypothetical protein
MKIHEMCFAKGSRWANIRWCHLEPQLCQDTHFLLKEEAYADMFFAWGDVSTEEALHIKYNKQQGFYYPCISDTWWHCDVTRRLARSGDVHTIYLRQSRPADLLRTCPLD